MKRRRFSRKCDLGLRFSAFSLSGHPSNKLRPANCSWKLLPTRLHSFYRRSMESTGAGRLLQAGTSTPLTDLRRCVRISAVNLIQTSLLQTAGRDRCFHSEGSITEFSKATFYQDQRIARINSFYRRIDTSIGSFHVSGDILEIASLIVTGGHNRYRRY